MFKTKSQQLRVGHTLMAWQMRPALMIIFILSEYIYRVYFQRARLYRILTFFHMLHERSHEEEPHVFLRSNEIGQKWK